MGVGLCLLSGNAGHEEHVYFHSVGNLYDFIASLVIFGGFVKTPTSRLMQLHENLNFHLKNIFLTIMVPKNSLKSWFKCTLRGGGPN